MIKTIPANDTMEGMAYMLPEIIYSSPGGKDLKLLLMKPWQSEVPEAPKKKWPLIVFIQGSAFRFPDIYRKIPQLAMFARAGFVVATIEHRSSLDRNPFPAFLEDAKTAVRFLRAHAGEYDIDPDHVAAWGSSSGGATALLLGLTGDFKEFQNGLYEGYSDSVNAVVDCFGPTDLTEEMDRIRKHKSFPYCESFYALVGNVTKERMEEMKAMSPAFYVKERSEFPPMLLMHGDKDPTVSYKQSKSFYDRLKEKGADVELVRVEGALHERSFWSQETLEEILEFLKEKL